MLPVEIYKVLACMIETPKCCKTLSLLCKNSALGCEMYIKEALDRSNINVQIIYNFSGHQAHHYWGLSSSTVSCNIFAVQRCYK